MSQIDRIAELTDLQETAVELKQSVAVVRFTRPQALNATTPRTHAEMARIFTAIGFDPDVRVAILTGTGD